MLNRWARASLSLALLLGGCDSGFDGDRIVPPPESLEEALEWVEVLLLEETDDVLIASPHLRPDPDGGWLFWDRGVDEARLYSADGGLRQVVGATGDGPGEYSGVRALIRLADRRLVTLDGRGRISVWDPSGEGLLKDYATGLPRVIGAVPADGNRIIVSTAPRFLDSDVRLAPSLHLLDVDAEEEIASGFSPSIPATWSTAVMTVEPPPPRRFEDSVYVALAVMDTVWALDASLEEATLVSSSLGSARIRENSSPVPASEGPAEFRAWTQDSWFLGDMMRLSDGRWIANTWTFQGEDFQGGLFLTDKRGDLEWDFPSQLRVLAKDDSGRVYLWDRGGMRPSEIHVVRIR